jgi:hypothetical protein
VADENDHVADEMRYSRVEILSHRCALRRVARLAGHPTGGVAFLVGVRREPAAAAAGEVRLPAGAEREAARQRAVRAEIGAAHGRAPSAGPVRPVVEDLVALGGAAVVLDERVRRCERVQRLQDVAAAHAAVGVVRRDLEAQPRYAGLLGHRSEMMMPREEENRCEN